MDQQELLAINTEFAAIVAEARNVAADEAPSNTGGGRVAMLFDPAVLYAQAAARLTTPDSDSVTVADFARAIRMAAAKIRAGDQGYITESLLGQAVWLQALALRLSDYAASLKDDKRKIALGGLLLKIQATATKTLATLAAINCRSGE